MLKQHKEFCNTQSPEALHQVRLNYKKLNALLLFFTEDRKKCVRTKAFKKLRAFYQRTGEVRDAQMSIRLLQKIEGNFQTIIQKKEKKALKRTEALIKKQIKDQAVIEKAGERTREFLAAIPNNILQERFELALITIRTELAPAIRNEGNLHDTRKLIKRTGYAGKMLPTILQSKIKLPFKDFKKIEDTIGQWHDSVVLAEYMQQHKGTLSAEELYNLSGQALQKAEKHMDAFLKRV